MVDRIATPSRSAAPPPSSQPSAMEQLPADVREWIKPIEIFIGDHPGACLASALIVGAAVAWWIKRR